MDAVEAQLLATSRIPANAGHSLHKGTPREAFIKEFLQDHLSERVAIGSGEIIDANSQPNQSRNQMDIVVFKRDFPKLNFGGGIQGFLAESAVATIEVKSTLDEKGLRTAVEAAHKIKALQRGTISGLTYGYVPPHIVSYVVAYDGPAMMQTVHGWLKPIHTHLGINYPSMGPTIQQRMPVPSPSLEGIFVLGKGFVLFDNSPLTFIPDQIRQVRPSARWVVGNMASGSLLLLFLLLTYDVKGVLAEGTDFTHYVPPLFINQPGFEE